MWVLRGFDEKCPKAAYPAKPLLTSL